MNPVDSHFRSLGLTSMEPVPKNSAEYDNLVAYARDTHGATHQYTATVRNAFRVERCAHVHAQQGCFIYTAVPLLELGRHAPGTRRTTLIFQMATVFFCGMDPGQRILLVSTMMPKFVMGRLMARFIGILKQGLRIAPPEGSYPYVVV